MSDKTESPSDPIVELGGEWSMVSCIRDGEPVPSGYVRWGKRVAKGDQMTVTMAGKTIMKAKFAIDPSKEPKAIDYVLTEGKTAGQTVYGIYELNEATLTFCLAAEGQARPTDFTSARGSGRSLTVWRRAKN